MTISCIKILIMTFFFAKWYIYRQVYLEGNIDYFKCLILLKHQMNIYT